jgi:pyridoxamine 5'-phosphate oxidase
MNLAEIDADAWHDLDAAGADAQSGFRYVNLCTVDPSGLPQARLVVLRSAKPTSRTIEIHTDIRSQKWTEISSNPSATVVGFDPEKGLQLRLQGTASLYPPASDIAATAWSRLSTWTKATYTGGPPGNTAPSGPIRVAEPENDDGRAVFGVIVFRAKAMDWFRLSRGDNRRATFRYAPDGALIESRLVNP